MAFNFIQTALEARKQNHLMRQRVSLLHGHGRVLTFEGRAFLNFSSNDYLGMATHPQVIKEVAQLALDQCGTGSGGSPMITGYSHSQSDLEAHLCDWLGFESCLLFTSGFAANSGVIQTLMTDPNSLLIQDKLNHASLIDAGIQCGSKAVRYRHNDMASLEVRLAGKGTDKLVATEGVFSMDGDTAPLAEIYQLTQAHQSWLMVDDAHGFGVLGSQGRGSVDHAKLPKRAVDIHMGTFGKAVGTMGAFVGGSADTIDYLVQFCRHYIYSTGMPPAMAAATLTSLQCLAKEQWRRDELNAVIQYFKDRMEQLGIADTQSKTAIQPIIIGDLE